MTVITAQLITVLKFNLWLYYSFATATVEFSQNVLDSVTPHAKVKLSEGCLLCLRRQEGGCVTRKKGSLSCCPKACCFQRHKNFTRALSLRLLCNRAGVSWRVAEYRPLTAYDRFSSRRLTADAAEDTSTKADLMRAATVAQSHSPHPQERHVSCLVCCIADSCVVIADVRSPQLPASPLQPRRPIRGGKASTL